MVLNIPILPFKHFVPLMAFCIKLIVLIPLNKMGFLKENIGTLLILVSLYSIGLIFLTITSFMHFLLLFFSLINYLLLSWTSSLLGKFYTLNHLLFKLLRSLVVLAILILGHTIKTSSNLSLKNVFFWVILHCLRAISVLILQAIRFHCLLCLIQWVIVSFYSVFLLYWSSYPFHYYLFPLVSKFLIYSFFW